jgi:succinate-semialdehyde dehydrogenase/glutarate-semialdehyde dehydrogenase
MLKLTDPGLFRQQAYIAGAWVDADSGGTVAVTNPANGEPLGTVPMCGTQETARAIAAADVAQRAWRAAILRRLNDLMSGTASSPASPRAR